MRKEKYHRRKITLFQEEKLKNGEKYVLCRLIVAMYDFNEK